MRTDILRREVAWDAATSTLIVGGRSTVVTCDPGDNECLLRTYLGLVAEQREVALGRGVHLRRDDIAVLAELLDLDDVDLESRLRRILHLSGKEAADLHRRLRRQRVAAAALGVGLLAGVPVGKTVAAAAEATTPPAVAVEVVDVDPVSPDSLDHPVTVTEAPAETEIGDAVRYERDPDYVAPEGVDIGDALVIERGSAPDGP